MKRLKIVVALVLVAMLLVLVSCVDKPKAKQLTDLEMPKLNENQMAVIIKNGERDFTSIVVTLGEKGTDAKTVEELLAYLADSGALQVEWQSGDYGKFLTKLGKLAPNPQNQYINVFTSVDADKGVWAGAKSYVIGEMSVTESNFGVSEMHVEAGAVVYFQMGSF